MSHWFAGFFCIMYMVILANYFLPKSAVILTLKLYFVSQNLPDREVLIHEIYKDRILWYKICCAVLKNRLLELSF